MKKIKKVIIPIAGWGTRFLPLTKVFFKEMIPILNKPLIDLLVNQCLDAGIKEIILIVSKRKERILDYFRPEFELEEQLAVNRKTDLLNLVKKTNKERHIKIIFQNDQLGLGHAISLAQNQINNEPFIVMLGDVLFQTDSQSVLKQMIESFEKLQSSIICVKNIEDHEVEKFGIIDFKPKEVEHLDHNVVLYQIAKAVEKPDKELATSNMGILGLYLFTPKLMKILCNNVNQNDDFNEIDLVSSINDLLQTENIFAYENKNLKWYDLGSVEGFVKANIDFALKDPQIRESILKHIQKKC